MIKYEIVFIIDNTSKLIIPLKDPIESLDPLCRETIFLLINKKKIILSQSTLYHNMIYLAEHLKKAFHQELFLYPFIIKNIGYYHNEYLYNATNLAASTLSHNVDWIGYKYHLWSMRNGLISWDCWIYNSPDSSIIFAVTPIYPYLFSEPAEEPDYIPYEEWIKNYKPYFMTTLSKETAQQWLKQAEDIINIVENNQKRWELRSKIDAES